MEDHVPSEICWQKGKMAVTIPNFHFRMHKDMDMFKHLIDESEKSLEYSYFNFNKLRVLLFLVEKRGKGGQICIGPRLFVYAIQILQLQKWQKEGKIDIGIKC